MSINRCLKFLLIFRAARHSIGFQRKGDSYGRLISVIPWLKDYFPNKTDYNFFLNTNKGLRSFIKDIIDKHLATHEEGHVRNFLDLYIEEMRKKEKDGEAKDNGFFCKILGG